MMNPSLSKSGAFPVIRPVTAPPVAFTPPGSAPPPRPPVQKPKLWVLSPSRTIFLFVLLGIGVYGLVTGQTQRDFSAVFHHAFQTRDSVAVDCAKDLLLRNLKAPATANFISTKIVRPKLPKTGFYLVHLVVDSQNGFGALIRSSYLCAIEPLGGGKYNYSMHTPFIEALNPPLEYEIDLYATLLGDPPVKPAELSDQDAARILAGARE